MDGPSDAMASAFTQRPDYRVDLLARTNTMSARLGGEHLGGTLPGRTQLGEARPGGALLASSNACLLVDEQDHGLVVYFPPDAVDFSLLESIRLRTRCPFKGEAVYWRAREHQADWVAWSYPAPYPQVARIAGYVAFDQDAVSVTIGTGRYTGVRP
jgi:uncharacterized protein (DUF427 family)